MIMYISGLCYAGIMVVQSSNVLVLLASWRMAGSDREPKVTLVIATES